MDVKGRYELRNRIRACTLCGLHAYGSGPVPFSGYDPCDLVVIGEAPGKKEDEEGVPFVGPAGQELHRWLADAGFTGTVAYMNVVCCYPGRTPTSKERDACSGNLAAQLAFLQPSYALVVGGIALSALVDTSIRVGEVRGLWFRINDGRTWALTTWHPAAVLRNPLLRAQAVEDVMMLTMIAREEMIPPLNEWCIKCGDFPSVYKRDFPLCERHSKIAL